MASLCVVSVTQVIKVQTTWSNIYSASCSYYNVSVLQCHFQKSFMCLLWDLQTATILHTSTQFHKPLYYESYYKLFILVLNTGHVCDTCTCYNLLIYFCQMKDEYFTSRRASWGRGSARRPHPCQVHTLKAQYRQKDIWPYKAS